MTALECHAAREYDKLPIWLLATSLVELEADMLHDACYMTHADEV